MGAPLIPMNNLSYLNAYLEAGAEEFYLGFYDPAWSQVFGPMVDINRMSGFGAQANAYSFTEACGIVQMISNAGKRAYVTFNCSSYGMDTAGFMQAYFYQLAYAGATGVILSGPELIDDAKSCGLQTVASTMCGVYNRDIATFYASCGIDRVILPRDLSVAEIGSIMVAEPELQYEVFLMRNGCIYSDAYCLGTHGQRCGALCGELRRATRKIHTTDDGEAVTVNSNLHAHEFHRYTCGLCALWDFEQLGVDAYKIVGRCDEGDAIATDIGLAKRNAELAAICTTRQEYLDAMERPPLAEAVCDRRLNCYYPETASRQ